MSIAAQAKDDDTFDSAHVLDPAATRDSQGQISEEIAAVHAQAQGETQPRLRIPFRKLFDGTQPPFETPVSGYGAGGFWTYLPLPYRESLKVVVRAPRLVNVVPA